jgi:hypothetical protein
MSFETDGLFPAVRPDLLKVGWEHFLLGLKSPAPTDERRFQRADSRLRYAVRADQRHGWTYVVRCHAFVNLLIELGDVGLGEWQESSEIPNLSGFHPAVLDAVATVPLRGRDGRFGTIEFLAAVKKTAHDKYGAHRKI